MKCIKALTLLTLIISSCAPVIRVKMTKELTPLTYADPLVILGEGESIPEEGIKVGQIKTRDGGFSIHCSYAQLMEIIKVRSRSLGANLAKVTYRKRPNAWSTCERLNVDLFFLDSITPYETEIVWAPDRKLKWDDFKRVDNDYDEQDMRKFEAVSHCGILTVPGGRTKGSHGVIVQTIFFTNTSWVKPDANSIELLEHEQGHFDLGEIYARKIRRDLDAAGKDAPWILGALHSKYFQEYKVRQQAYDKECEHGTNTSYQNVWNATIKSELKALDIYKLK